MGRSTYIELKGLLILRDGEPLIAALSEDRVYEPGAQIGFDFNTERAQLFPAED